MSEQKFPAGWDQNRVKKLLTHYEGLSEEEMVAEDEAAYEQPSQTIMSIPTELVPAVRELITRRNSA